MELRFRATRNWWLRPPLIEENMYQNIVREYDRWIAYDFGDKYRGSCSTGNELTDQEVLEELKTGNYSIINKEDPNQ